MTTEEIKEFNEKTKDELQVICHRKESFWESVAIYCWYRPKLLVKDMWYWIKTHTWKRFHILDMRHTQDKDWRYGWRDKDTLILYACFKLLVKFVEEEDPQVGLRSFSDYGCKDGDEFLVAQLTDEAEIRRLYNWWTKEYFKKRDYIEYEMPIKYPEYFDACRALEDEEQLMLHRLINVRKTLWT